jgi:uncharacterized protein (DUF1330 family)
VTLVPNEVMIKHLEGWNPGTNDWEFFLLDVSAEGSKILVAGPDSTAIEGNPDPITVVLEFPTRDALQGWYDSPEYQAIIHHRTDNSEGSMVFADEFVMPG